MAESLEAFEKAGAGYQRPNLRSDLRLVYENPATGKGQVRVIDPQGGRQFVFDENEQHLCRLADGRMELKDIYAQLVADRGSTMTPTQVVEFYRRLHILGLLAPAAAPSASAAPASPAPTAPAPRGPGALRGRGPARGALAAASSGGDAAPRESAASRVAARRSQAAAAQAASAASHALPAPETPAGEPAAPLVADTSAGETAAAAAQPEIVDEVIDPIDAFLSDPLVVAPKSAATKAAAAKETAVPKVEAAPPAGAAESAPPAFVAALPATLDAVTPVAKSAAEVEPAARKQGGLRALLGGRRPQDPANLSGPATMKGDTGASSRPAKDDPMLDEVPAAAEAEETSFDLSDIDFFDEEVSRPGMGGGMLGGMGGMGAAGGMMGGMGGMRGQAGGMRGGMRGQAGGMGGGMGGMPGGMGGMGGMRGQAGGMGAGMGGMGPMPGMGGMGGMRGGMGGMGAGMGGMPGGMRGGMGGMGGFNQMQQPPKPFKKKPWQLGLFNPTLLLQAIYYLFYPLKYAVWLTLPAVIFSGMIMLNHYKEFAFDFTATVTNFGTLGELAVALLIVNLFARLAQGVALISHGAKVRYIGLTLALGMFPHISIDKHDAPTLDKTGQMWVHGSTLLTRLLLFCAGIIFWEVTRQSGTIASELALMTSKCALAMFVATAWPLMPSDGMRLMATAMNEPKLQPKMVMTFKYLFMGGKLPPFISREELPMLTLFTIGSALTGVAFLGFLAVTGFFGVMSWGGLGMIIWAVYCTAFALWIAAVLRAAKGGAKGKSQPGFDRGTMGFLGFDDADTPVLDEAADAESLANVEDNPTKYAGRVWLLIALAGAAVAFLPYNYETGGVVTILPLERGQAVARTDGEILRLLVREGDVVTAGQPVAVLSSWDQESQIAITEAQLDGAKASLAKLLAGATPEEIAVARAKVVSAEADLAYTKAQAERARNLAATGTVSSADKEKAESALASVLADLDVARANLAQIEAPPTQADIDIAEANVDKLTRQLAYDKDELARTTVVAPVDGRVVTQDMNLKIGTYLKSGETLMEVEETEVVTANIDVPEGDAPFLTTGRPVRLKLQGFADTEFPGEVMSVAPSAETQAYGQTVQVMVNFPNVDGKIVSGMTGYAKIEGAEMRVWEAYLRTIKRFFQIQVWSWIP